MTPRRPGWLRDRRQLVASNQETHMNDPNDAQDTGSGSRWRRRTVLGALGAAPVAAAAALSGTGTGLNTVLAASDESGQSGESASDRIPRDTRPGGSYDRYVAELAAQDKFSGVVLLAHRGRTVLSRSYGMADTERGIPIDENTVFNLASASGPFLPVAILQLLQEGQVTLSDTVGTHLTGIATDIAEQVTIHHIMAGTSGIAAPEPDWQRIFSSREEVREYYEQWTRQATLGAVPGSPDTSHSSGNGASGAMAGQIVEAVTAMTWWDYVREHVFGRAGMSGSAYYTRDEWLTDEHIAHPYMRQADGSRVDAVRNLDKGTLDPFPDRNPGRDFIGYIGGGFATAPDLARFAHALSDGALLNRPYADLYTGAKLPMPEPTAYEAYAGPVEILNGTEWLFGRGGGAGGITVNWDVYPDTGWVSVILSNYDDIPLGDIIQREVEAITGQPYNPPGGGG
jgi:CubicO group peptidase (beta-lactamase class C family)